MDRHAARSRYVQFAKIAALRDFELEMHQIKTCNGFRHRVFDLQARVEFDEGERSIAAKQELNGSKAGIIGSFGNGSGVFPKGVALCR